MVRSNVLTMLAGTLAISGVARGAGFTAGDLVVLRLGDASHPGTTANSAVPVYLDEYNLANPAGSAPVYTVGPIQTAGGNPFTIGSDGDHNATLNLSADGQYLVFGGYEKAAGGSNPNNDTAAVSPRVIATVNAGGTVNASTILTDAFNQLDMRSVASVNGTSFYIAGKGAGDGSGGIRLANVGASTSTSLDPHFASPVPAGTIGTYTDTRDVVVLPGPVDAAHINAQLFTPSGSSGNGAYGVGNFGSGLPMAAAAWAPLNGYPTGTNGKTTSIWFADLSSAVAGPDTMYAVTDTELVKYSLGTDGAWTETGDLATSVGAEKLFGMQSGSTVNLFYSFESGTQGIYEVTDTGGYGAGFSFSTLPTTPYISPAANTVLRGLAGAPVSTPEPAVMGLVATAGLVVGRRRRR